jgi:hypothetical protein
MVDRVAEALTEGDVDRFIRYGIVLLKGAFPRSLADECRRLLWQATGCAENDRTMWNRPVIRIDGRGDAPFAAAINTARLQSTLSLARSVGCREAEWRRFRFGFPLSRRPVTTVGTSSPLGSEPMGNRSSILVPESECYSC